MLGWQVLDSNVVLFTKSRVSPYRTGTWARVRTLKNEGGVAPAEVMYRRALRQVEPLDALQTEIADCRPQVLGLVLICLAIALSLRSWPVVAFLVPIVLIQLATAPLSAHMVSRQAYRNGTIDRSSLYVDELAERRQTPPAAGG